eukprot:Gregarina_sp_Poly_1__4003@NODE_2208_length_2486_cov_80_608516_g1423_i0_p1_GENE_NODE_2208_length_2486_cov_80_608516_g1423_i0NODE_2208_length_2486_cov_80_608516_g1423_i0_p1_ORF_typecomplete_len809_score150_23DEAD/PF00270_29/1_8e47DEAD/PF00270_29/2e02Helicase_C/PF00271_31/4_6e02Helicase_C/PF00271_31/6_8e27ResIII/PF04851_15/1_4e11ERCC3_RAD25_C/PF16203_5/3_2e07Flavi_DEAD/PF07652_14/1_7e06DBP10CT/PF08147_12/6_8e06UTP25/PF06862_12/7e02UTP25/PF06862_12/0_0079UTP25/PF06862_12/28AAA_19/PF13245_6/0_39AAA_1
MEGSGDAVSINGDTVDKTEKKPKRLRPFERLGLSERTCAAVKKMGFLLPTPIQRKAIPAILRSSGDIVAMARTGSGKTAAFLLPLVDKLDCHSQIVGVRGIVVSPTRELATQTYKVCHRLLFGTDLRVCRLVGGTSMQEQFGELANNPDILIATPGRLAHHMIEADLSLTRVAVAVFDEADQLWELNLEEDVHRILKGMKLANKQCILMSATIPQRLADFARIQFINPIFIQLDSDKQLSEKLTLNFFYCRQNDKLPGLLFWLSIVKEPAARVLIFCASRHHTNFLAELLRSQRIDCCVIAGTMSVAQRQESMEAFTKKKCCILLATDVAARGVDIDKLEYVFHYDFPPSAKLFVHRSGRTARKNQSGTAVSLVTKDDVPFLVELMLFLGRRFRIPTEEASRSASPSAGLTVSDSLIKSKNDDLELGGFPNLDHERQIVAEEMRENVELERLHRSAISSHAEYLRYRIPASKMSLQRAGELLNSLGGPSKLADDVHSKLREFEAKLSTIYKRKQIDNNSFLGNVTESAKTPTPAAQVDVESIRQFRPSKTAASARGMGVASSVRSGVHNIIRNRKLVSDLAAHGLHNVEGGPPIIPTQIEDVIESPVESVEAAIAMKRKISKAERKRLRSRIFSDQESGTGKKRQKCEDYFLDAAPDECSRQLAAEMKLNAKMCLEQHTLDILGEDSQELRKSRRFMKWNPVKKKYEVTELDKEGKRVKQKDASGTTVRGEFEKKGIYKKWLRTSERRIQKSGEEEDTLNTSLRRKGKRECEEINDAIEPMPLESITRDLGNENALRRPVLIPVFQGF